MNSRFRFRIFDKETGKYYKTRISRGSGCIVYQHPASSHYAWIQIGTMFAELERDEKTYANTGLEPDFIIEQCTGLSDKNGNLIYENDLIKTANYKTGLPEIYVVKWCDECGIYQLESTQSDQIIDMYRAEKGIICGNIHEQAEQKD